MNDQHFHLTLDSPAEKTHGSHSGIQTDRRIWLRARGDDDPESDLDLFIEVADLNNEIRELIQTAAWEVSLENGVMISTFIASSNSLTNSMLTANPLLKVISCK